MAKGDLKLHWHRDNPVVHKVKPPKSKKPEIGDYEYFLVCKMVAIQNYLRDSHLKSVRETAKRFLELM